MTNTPDMAYGAWIDSLAEWEPSGMEDEHWVMSHDAIDACPWTCKYDISYAATAVMNVAIGTNIESGSLACEVLSGMMCAAYDRGVRDAAKELGVDGEFLIDALHEKVSSFHGEAS